MDKQHKKQIKRYIAWACLAAFTLLLSVMPLLAGKQAAEDGPQASILTAKAGARDLKTQIIGGGQLAGESSEAVTLPAAVKLTEYLVSNGDTVAAGDPIARVDKVSVMVALEQVQETLDYLAEEIAGADSNSATSSVTAQAGGRVKVIYGKAGDSVRDVMLEHGALAVLSLDGRMAVRMDSDTDLNYGSALSVVLSDGSRADGRVESASGGSLVVSVPDQNYPIGETVTVETSGGAVLGSGELYIHNPWNATAYYGTISSVAAAEGFHVNAGSTLFYLENSEKTPEFQILNAQRQEYEELMQELFTMYDTGFLAAPCNGFITGVDSNSFLLSAQQDSQEWYVMLLGNEESEAPSGGTEDPPSGSDDPDVPATEPEDPPVDPGEGGYKVRVGQVIAADQGALSLKAYPADVSCDSLSEVAVSTALMTSTIARNISGTTVLQMDLATPYGSDIVKGDILFFVTDTASGSSYVVWAGNQPVSEGIQIPGGLGGLGGLGGWGGMGGGAQAEVFEPYSLETVTVATVTSQERMTLEVTIDEQDITKLQTGMEASITVDALTGQSFPATITKISNTGTNAGGSSKFTVRFTLSKSGDMLPGMHASAFLTMETAASVLTIPVAALQESGTEVFVYTSYDETEEIFKNPVAVTTGVSDGEYVQILSGLAEGDTVFYPYYDTLEISNIPEPAFGF